MATNDSETTPTPDRVPERLEDLMARLETLVAALERDEAPLEESLARFEEALAIGRRCRSILERAEARVRELVDVDEDGDARTRPFDVDA